MHMKHKTRREKKLFKVQYLILSLPVAAMLLVPSYIKMEPQWKGIPFFYWYQSLWVLLATLLMGIVYIILYRRP